jgi:hypothetical protein
MPQEREIEEIIGQVKPWPQEDRVAPAYLMVCDMRKKTREPVPQRTLDRALGIAKGSAPPPDDATVKMHPA